MCKELVHSTSTELLICNTKCSAVYLTQVLEMGGFVMVCLQPFLERERTIYMLRLIKERKKKKKAEPFYALKSYYNK